jgi:hypothetical protein
MTTTEIGLDVYTQNSIPLSMKLLRLPFMVLLNAGHDFCCGIRIIDGL